MTHAPHDHALVIGIDHYPRWNNGDRSLDGAARDAEDFRDWLTDPRGGGLLPQHARLVEAAEDPLAPVKHMIDKELEWIRDNTPEKERRRFYFYFSGHGYSPISSDGKQVLCMANWSLRTQGAALELESYIRTAVCCLNFEEALFFLDCCRDRQIAPWGQISELECGDTNYRGRQRAVLYATEHYTSAFEGKIEDDVRGYFTAALMGILRWRTITLTDLKARLAEEVRKLAGTKNQVASFQDLTNREIILGPPPVGGAVPPPPGPKTLAPGPGPKSRFEIKLSTNLVQDSDVLVGGPNLPPPGEIAVFHGDEEVARGRGELSILLPDGDYRVDITHGETRKSYQVSLPEEPLLEVELPRRLSAAPLSSTEDKAERITDPIVARSTWKPCENEQAIFVVSRPRLDIRPSEHRAHFTLWGDGPHPEHLTSDMNLRKVRPGTHELRYDDPAGSATLFIPVAKGWDTQVFLIEQEGRPLLERASIFMRPAGAGFHPGDSLFDAYERALADLITDGEGPDRNTLELLLNGKWKSPLFGLVGAHFMFRDARRGAESHLHNPHMADTVIRNLGRLLGEDAPDVVALRVLRALTFEDELPELTVHDPPLFRAGFDALVEATGLQPHFHGFGALALSLRADSPWTVAAPTPRGYTRSWSRAAGTTWYGLDEERREPIEELLDLHSVDHRIGRGRDGRPELEAPGLTGDEGDALTHRIDLQARIPSTVTSYVRSVLEQAERNDRAPDMPDLVRRTRLPRHILEAAMEVETLRAERKARWRARREEEIIHMDWGAPEAAVPDEGEGEEEGKERPIEEGA